MRPNCLTPLVVVSGNSSRPLFLQSVIILRSIADDLAGRPDAGRDVSHGAPDIRRGSVRGTLALDWCQPVASRLA